MITGINIMLNGLCTQLSGLGSGNYVATIQFYQSIGSSGRNISEAVTAALRAPVLIQDTVSVDRAEVISRLKEGLEYAGDHGAHPNHSFLASNQFKKEEEAVLEFLDEFLSDAGQIISFYLKDGHPFYPVFWDFAFLIEKNSDSFVFIGSSSD